MTKSKHIKGSSVGGSEVGSSFLFGMNLIDIKSSTKSMNYSDDDGDESSVISLFNEALSMNNKSCLDITEEDLSSTEGSDETFLFDEHHHQEDNNHAAVVTSTTTRHNDNNLNKNQKFRPFVISLMAFNDDTAEILALRPSTTCEDDILVDASSLYDCGLPPRNYSPPKKASGKSKSSRLSSALNNRMITKLVSASQKARNDRREKMNSISQKNGGWDPQSTNNPMTKELARRIIFQKKK